MVMPRKTLLAFLLVLLFGGACAYYDAWKDEKAEVFLENEPTVENPESDKGTDKILVYVTGAVNRPGMVELAPDARAANAVNACGGFSPDADENAINLAQKIKDGQHIKVPSKFFGDNAKNLGQAPTEFPKDNGLNKNLNENNMVNINTANMAELDTLPGVGPAMAKRIIEYRESEGGFAAPEDIQKVRGIGPANYEKMKDRITI